MRQPATGLTGLTVTFLPPEGSELGSIVQTVPLTGAGIAVSPDDYLPLDVAGAWTMQVSATTPTGNLPGRRRRAFIVRNADGSLPTSDIGSLPERPGRDRGDDHDHHRPHDHRRRLAGSSSECLIGPARRASEAPELGSTRLRPGATRSSKGTGSATSSWS